MTCIAAPRLVRPLYGPSGPQWSDVSQSMTAADCYFVASVQAVARDPSRAAQAFEVTPHSVHVICYPSSSGPANQRLPARVAVQGPLRAQRRADDWVTCLREAFQTTEGYASTCRQRDAAPTLRWLTGHALTLNLAGGARVGVEIAFMVRRFRAGDVMVIGTLRNAYVVVAAEDDQLQVRSTRNAHTQWLGPTSAWGFIYCNVTVSARQGR